MGCCCGEKNESAEQARCIVGWLETPAGRVPQVAAKLGCADYLGAGMVRLGIRRMRYRVAPGLYAVGTPASDAPVLVTANYKLTFDLLRRELGGRNLWLLVLDTQGVNVWCAAGKGTFGTEEVVRRIECTRLAQIVSGRTLVLPQLGAPGVAAQEVRQRSGFRVVYGPVRACDLPAFLDGGMQATPAMRLVTFGLWQRLVLIPVEVVNGARYLAGALLAVLLLGGFSHAQYSLDSIWGNGGPAALLLCAAYLLGTVGAPLLLPWLPGRAFAMKGAVLGGLVGGFGMLCGVLPWQPVAQLLNSVSGVLVAVAMSSFLAMNFTGASTYTSLSGVRKEMRVAVPLQLAGMVMGAGLWVAGRFL